MGGDREVRSITKDGGAAEVEASGAIPSFILSLMRPKMWDLTVREDMTLSLCHDAFLAALIFSIALRKKLRVGTSHR